MKYIKLFNIDEIPEEFHSELTNFYGEEYRITSFIVVPENDPYFTEFDRYMINVKGCVPDEIVSVDFGIW